MRVMTSEEVRDKFGITPEQVDEWEGDAANGVLHEEPRGEVAMGRLSVFGKESRQVDFRESVSG